MEEVSVRGSEKKIIYVKDTGSKIFEEAYFVIRRGVDAENPRPTENDMVEEATRILSQNGADYPASHRRRRRIARWISFLAGALTAASFLGGAWLLSLL